MGRKEVYAARMQELGWTSYRLSQEILKLRNARGETPTFHGLESTIRKALKDPDSKSAIVNDDIIRALGGDITIRWTSHTEVKL